MPPTNAWPRLGVLAWAGAGRVARTCGRPPGTSWTTCRAKENVRYAVPVRSTVMFSGCCATASVKWLVICGAETGSVAAVAVAAEAIRTAAAASAVRQVRAGMDFLSERYLNLVRRARAPR